MMVLLDSLIILQVECQKSFLNKHQIIFEIKTPDQIFKTPIGKLILVKEMNCVYEITKGFKDVFVSLYKKTLSEK